MIEKGSSYFIRFCLDLSAYGETNRHPVNITLESTSDQDALAEFEKWIKQHGATYDGWPYSERPKLLRRRADGFYQALS